MTAMGISRKTRRPGGSSVRRVDFISLSTERLSRERKEFLSTTIAAPAAEALAIVVVFALLTLQGCSRPNQGPEAVPSQAAETIPSTTPTPQPAAPPLTQRLADQLWSLRELQLKRHDLLRDFKVELAQLTADLRAGIRREGLELEPAVQQLKQPPPQGPLAELSLKYRRCAALRVQIQRLSDTIDSDRLRLGKIEFAEASLRQQEKLAGVSVPADREKAERLLEEAAASDEFNPDEVLKNPDLARTLDDAYQQVQQNLRARIASLPGRTEKSLDQLPKLPDLDFKPADLAEQVLLDALRQHLEAGQAEATRLLTATQPEAAIDTLHGSLDKARAELEAYPRPPAWKSDCLSQFEQTQTALSEQLAEPYVSAIERAIPEARKKQDWGPVLDLLEELLRLAPRAAKLTELINTIDVLLQWRENTGDVEAAVARERFRMLREQVIPGSSQLRQTAPHTKVASKSSEPPNAPAGPNASASPTPTSRVAPGEIQFAAWQQAHEALHFASRHYCELESELKAILVDYQATAPKVQQKQAELDEQRKVVEAKLAEQDRAEQDVFGQYARLIAKRQQAYEHVTKTLGMKSTAPESVQLERQIAGLRAEQRPYAAGNDRAGGCGAALDIVAVARRAGFSGLKPGDPLVLSYQGVDIPLRWCPPGAFRMGSPAGEPGRREDEGQVEVTLSTGYWIAETETTQQLWQMVVGSTLRQQASIAGHSESIRGEGPNYPMYYVNHDEATSFCHKLDDHFRQSGTLPDDWQVTLPTEAQWEYACRAGSTTAYCFGNDEKQLEQYAWFDKNSGGATHPVAQKQFNDWRLCDMHGNMWEWCADRYGESYGRLSLVDPTGPKAGSSRVLRGGAWCYYGSFCRSACRFNYEPTSRLNYIGFRFVVSVFRRHLQ